MVKVFVSIINFNGRKNTLDCLDSIKKLAKKDFDLETVVIDNASSQEFDLPKEYSWVKLIRSTQNLGFSGGHNKVIKYCLEKRATHIIVLNNDTVVDKNLILELLKNVSLESGIGIVAPKIYFYKGFEFHKDRYKEEEKGKVFWYAGGIMDWENVIGRHRGVDEVDKGQYDKSIKTDFASGACMMISKEVFEKVGLFDERYFLYYEDNDLCLRAKKNGFKIYYAPKAILWHKNAGSAGGSGSALQDYYITRNRMLFGMKFAPFRSRLSLIRESFNLLLRGRTWQKRGVLDFYRGKFGKGSYNTG